MGLTITIALAAFCAGWLSGSWYTWKKLRRGGEVKRNPVDTKYPRWRERGGGDGI